MAAVDREDGRSRYERFRRAIAGERLPCALVDLDAFDANVDTAVAPVRQRKKTVRVATKSVRAPALMKQIEARGGDAIRGVMTFDARETAFLCDRGWTDLLLAYPTLQRQDLALLVAANARGATAAMAVDALEHLDALDAVARDQSTIAPVVIDVDVSWRPFGERFHVGVRRSPVRDVDGVLGLLAAIRSRPSLRFHGVMAYEAQIAGVQDDVGPAIERAATRVMKSRSRAEIARRRRDIADALRSAGAPLTLFDGGGTGSIESSSEDDALTEVAAGSGFLCPHLFDRYREISLIPACFYALQIVRAPSPTIRTCHGGGFVASGATNKDRLPKPALPEGLSLLALEGAGEVQTPLSIDRVARGARLEIGDPVFFRHAKAGELAEHFSEYLLVRGDRVVGRASTYRGLGQSFIG